MIGGIEPAAGEIPVGSSFMIAPVPEFWPPRPRPDFLEESYPHPREMVSQGMGPVRAQEGREGTRATRRLGWSQIKWSQGWVRMGPSSAQGGTTRALNASRRGEGGHRGEMGGLRDHSEADERRQDENRRG